jgi:transcriptional regulator with XRE-family HTH domain
MAEKLPRQNGTAIRYYRIKDGKKPGEFATEARIAYSTLDNIENERKEASVEVIYRIARVLDIDPKAIVRDPASLLATERVPA